MPFLNAIKNYNLCFIVREKSIPEQKHVKPWTIWQYYTNQLNLHLLHRYCFATAYWMKLTTFDFSTCVKSIKNGKSLIYFALTISTCITQHTTQNFKSNVIQDHHLVRINIQLHTLCKWNVVQFAIQVCLCIKILARNDDCIISCQYF